jgi:hypothetical protein
VQRDADFARGGVTVADQETRGGLDLLCQGAGLIQRGTPALRGATVNRRDANSDDALDQRSQILGPHLAALVFLRPGRPNIDQLHVALVEQSRREGREHRQDPGTGERRQTRLQRAQLRQQAPLTRLVIGAHAVEPAQLGLGLVDILARQGAAARETLDKHPQRGAVAILRQRRQSLIRPFFEAGRIVQAQLAAAHQ